MIEFVLLSLLALFILLFGLISGRIRGTIITPPMVFVGVGILFSRVAVDYLDLGAHSELINLLAEWTLVLVLFTDASRIDLGLLKHHHNIPVRLLGVGLPLTILLGAIAAHFVLGGLTLWEGAVLAAILAPTDAALGQAVVSNRRVPNRIRQALNVESGLNDGIALPFLLLFIGLASISEDVGGAAFWVRFTVLQLTLGPLVGILVGYAGGWLILRASRAGWIDDTFERLSVLALAFLAYALALLVGGNGFIAAFAAGLVVGNTAQDICPRLREFAEAEGQLLTLVTFLAFGTVMVVPVFAGFHWSYLVYAVLSLTVIRMAPVAAALTGLQLKGSTKLFLGWFGPRGIASIVYVFLLADHEGIAGVPVIYQVAVLTVFLSVFAHGVTAAPWANWYGRRMHAMQEDEAGMRETVEVPEMPLRLRA